MKHPLILLLALFILTKTHAQRLADLENDTIDSTDKADDRYNRDNKIYKSNKEFIFDYIIVKEGDSLYCQFSKQVYGIPNWQLVKSDKRDTNTVHTISLVVLPYYMNNDQTGIAFRYFNQDKKLVTEQWTGLIENDKNTWLHPPRAQFFAITEFSTFPFIKTPYVIGRKWKSGLTVGYYASYVRFSLKWEGILNLREDLEIIDKVELKTALGQLPCYVVQGISKSHLTESKTLFYFNETYGFVKIVYDLFDKSRLELNLIEVR
jgi:hypothetical protein